MGLVGYSDSEGSEDEGAVASSKAQPKTDTSSKRGFQKVVDRSNPNKIRVNLPEGSTEKSEGGANEYDGPPSKKKKLGGSFMGGFNAMLPAPKRTGVSGAGNAASAPGLRKGVSLKTSAAPGFTREPIESAPPEEDGQEDQSGAGHDEPHEEDPTAQTNVGVAPEVKSEPPLKGKVTMFKPLSVARKPAKAKKKTDPEAVKSGEVITDNATASPKAQAAKPKPKVSLFSSYTDDDHPVPTSNSNGDYQTMLYESRSGDVPESTMQTTENAQQRHAGNQAGPTQAGGQSLDTIAQDLNLSAAAKRQLFGRSGKAAGANIVTFDTDAEYTANEEFRANQDMQEVRNPVRGIASGKHSLRQLVNSAVGQKEALEDHFAAGRRNKREAGSKYGW